MRHFHAFRKKKFIPTYGENTGLWDIFLSKYWKPAISEALTTKQWTFRSDKLASNMNFA